MPPWWQYFSRLQKAEVLCGMLRAAGVECGHRLTEEDDSPFEGIATDGMRKILVRQFDLDGAQSLLAENELDAPASSPLT
jgi:hypothetical protein